MHPPLESTLAACTVKASRTGGRARGESATTTSWGGERPLVTFSRTAYCWIFWELSPFSGSGGSTPSFKASSAHVLSSFVSSFRISSKRLYVLKLLPPLFGGAWKFSRREAVFECMGTPGLQYKMKLTKASSMVAAVTFRSGSARRTAPEVDGDCDLRGGDALRAAAAAGAGGGTYAGCSIVIECFSRGGVRGRGTCGDVTSRQRCASLEPRG